MLGAKAALEELLEIVGGLCKKAGEKSMVKSLQKQNMPEDWV